MKISIITATKNNKAGLLRAIESVRSQTYKNVEHIIVDGGSTDGTGEVIKNLAYRQAGVQFTINNDTSSRAACPDLSGESRDLKISLPIDRGRNDKDQGDNANVILRQAQYDEAQGNKTLITNHYSLITISEADNGIYDAINKGIKLATGDVIGLLHSDDFYADEFVLERVAEAFQDKSIKEKEKSFNQDKRLKEKDESFIQDKRLKDKEKSIPSSRIPAGVRDLKISPSGRNDNEPPATDHQKPTIDAVYSDLVYVRSKKREARSENEDLKSIDHSALNIEHSVLRNWKTHSSHFDSAQCDTRRMTKLILKGWMPPHPTLFVRKEIFDKYGLYRTDMKIAADYEMILRLFYKHKITTNYLPLTTYCMTIGGASNKSLKNIFIKSSEDYRALKLHGIPFVVKTLLMKNLRKLPQFFLK